MKMFAQMSAQRAITPSNDFTFAALVAYQPTLLCFLRLASDASQLESQDEASLRVL